MDRGGHAPRRTWRGASLVVALCLSAAACSSSTPASKVGATLPAMNGTVTLVKVFYPVTVTADSPGFPPLTRQLAALVLTVHSPSGAAAKFSDIYGKSTLIGSDRVAYPSKSTAKFKVGPCLTYPAFGPLAAGATMTGCEIFALKAGATPLQLDISGKAPAVWRIAPSDIQAGPVGSAGAVPSPTAGVPTPTTSTPGSLSSPSTTAVTNITGVSTPGASSATTTPATTLPAPTAVASSHRHHRSSAAHIAIGRIAPDSGYAGVKVTISGHGLGHATQVTFNGVPALIRKSSAARLVVIVPAGATTGPVVVSTALVSLTGSKDFQIF